MFILPWRLALILSLLLAFVPCGAARAGTMALEWDPVPDQGLVGYRISYATIADGPFDGFLDVDLSTQQSLTGLADCTYYYVRVQSRRSDGTLSTEASNVVEGFPHPELLSSSHSTIGRGGTTRVTLSGSGFVPGATLDPGASGVYPRSLSVDACDRLTVDLAVADDAPVGPLSLTVINPDHGAGTRADLVGVGAQPAPFEVLSVSPAASSLDADPLPTVRVTFTRIVDPASLTSSVVQLVRAGGSEAVKLDGPPSVDGAGATASLTPAVPLEPGRSYSLRVKGGANGARAASGDGLLQTFLQTPFRVRPFFVGALHASADGSNPEELLGSETVAADSRILATFSEPLDPATISSASVRIVVPGKGRVRLSGSGEPILLGDQQTVALVPASPLPSATTLVLQVRGGAGGVRSMRGVQLGARKVKVRFRAAPAGLQSLAVAD